MKGRDAGSIPHPFLFVFREVINMIDFGSLLYNIKYKGDGVRLVDQSIYIKKIAYSRDTTSSGMEYQAAQINKVNDYNEEARKLLALYH